MAAELPAELVQRVLDFIVLQVHPDSESTRRKHLARCSLTCRYWAQRCRPELFARLTLRSVQDVQQLLAFLQDASSIVRKHLRSLTLAPQHFDAPWTHLVPLHVLPLCSTLADTPPVTIRLSLRCPRSDLSTPCAACAGPSVYADLPRQGTPSCLSTAIQSLVLKRVKFEGFSQLWHLLSGLPLLRSLELEKVDWFPSKKESVAPSKSALPFAVTQLPPRFLEHIVCQNLASTFYMAALCLGFMTVPSEGYLRSSDPDSTSYRFLPKLRTGWNRARALEAVIHQEQFITVVQCISAGVSVASEVVRASPTEDFRVKVRNGSIDVSYRAHVQATAGLWLIPRLMCTYVPSDSLPDAAHDEDLCTPFWTFCAASLDFCATFPAPEPTSYAQDLWPHTPWAHLFSLLFCLPHLSTLNLAFPDRIYWEQWKAHIATVEPEPRKSVLLSTIVCVDQSRVRKAARMRPVEILDCLRDEGRLLVSLQNGELIQ